MCLSRRLSDHDPQRQVSGESRSMSIAETPTFTPPGSSPITRGGGRRQTNVFAASQPQSQERKDRSSTISFAGGAPFFSSRMGRLPRQQDEDTISVSSATSVFLEADGPTIVPVKPPDKPPKPPKPSRPSFPEAVDEKANRSVPVQLPRAPLQSPTVRSESTSGVEVVGVTKLAAPQQNAAPVSDRMAPAVPSVEDDRPPPIPEKTRRTSSAAHTNTEEIKVSLGMWRTCCSSLMKDVMT